jgi:transcriptional regulator GlxA family with amidase domain
MSTSPHRLAVVVTEGMPVFEFAIPCEVFGIDRSDLADPWYDLRLTGVRPGTVQTAADMFVRVGYGLDELTRADTVLIAACGTAYRDSPPAELLDALRAAHASGARMASVCAGSFLLAAAGLLDGRPATTHWLYADEFQRDHPRVRFQSDVLYTDDGDILTSAGTGAGIDLCLHIVRRDHGHEVANAVARRMVLPPHREGGQAQYVPRPVPAASGDTLAATLDWARNRLDQPLTVADLARHARLSPRTFARRMEQATGTSPLRWLLAQRIALAQHLLESTAEPVEWVAARAGLGTAANLRDHFRRTVSVSPQAYRTLFRTRAEQPAARDAP